jgi:S-DNA-T family DNA segregation ATPase FtsK/SpoIIIE
LDQLAERYDIAALPPAAAGGAAFGLIDDPARQVQYGAVYEPDRDGNLLVLGGAGAGKSTALRTVALAAMLDAHVGPVHVYGIDAAGGGLDMLRPLPAVADVVDSEDVERVGRMFTRLVGVVRERSRAFTATRASGLLDYRERTGDGEMPRILVVIDGYGSFQNDYMNEMGRQQVFMDFRDVLAQGRSVGVNVVLAADRLGALHTSVQALMSRTLVLRLNEEANYGMLGLRATGLTAESPPGRGIDLTSRKEIQVAVMGGSSRIDEQARAVEAFAVSAPRGEQRKAEAIPRMPRAIGSRDVPAHVGGMPVLGIDGATLFPRGFDLDRPIIIAGQAGTGRTSALAWMACAIRRSHPGLALVHVTQRRTSIGALPAWTASFVGVSAGDDLLEAWGEALDTEAESGSRVVVCMENVQDFGASLSDGAVVQALKRARRNGHLLIGEADTQGWVSGPLVAELKSARRGLLLAPELGDAQVLFGVASARMNRAEVPPGRGIWVEAGRVATVQVPWVDDGLSPDC